MSKKKSCYGHNPTIKILIIIFAKCGIYGKI